MFPNIVRRQLDPKSAINLADSHDSPRYSRSSLSSVMAQSVRVYSSTGAHAGNDSPEEALLKPIISLAKPSQILPNLSSFDDIELKDATIGSDRRALSRRDDRTCPHLAQLIDSELFLRAAFEGRFNLSDERLLHRLRDSLKSLLLPGQILVDLGAGRFPFGYFFARALGATSYVAVETATPGSLAFWMAHQPGPTPKPGETLPAATVIPATIGEVLNAQPDKSVSLLISGIEQSVCSSEEREAIERVTQRVIHGSGTALVFQSHVKLHNLTPKALSIPYGHTSLVLEIYSPNA